VVGLGSVLLVGLVLVVVVPISARELDCGTLTSPHFTDSTVGDLAADSSTTTVVAVEGVDLPASISDLPTLTHYLARGKRLCDDARDTRQTRVALLIGIALPIAALLLFGSAALNRRRS
jgi:hypothetical protein